MASKELHHPNKSFSPSTDTSSPSSESFAFETKFIVLNFIGQNPHERHPGCVYSSTTSSAASDSNPFPFHSKKGHQSFPTSPRKLVKTHKLGHLDASFHASEDNVNYKYKKEHKKLNEPSVEPFEGHLGDSQPTKSSSADKIRDKRHFKSVSLDHGLNQGRYFQESDSSPVIDVDKPFVSERTPFLNYRQSRVESELSSDVCNLSYTSDADDEYESTTSSLFSSFTEPGGRGSREQRLSIVKSESELETDVSTVAGDISTDGVGLEDDIFPEEQPMFRQVQCIGQVGNDERLSAHSIHLPDYLQSPTENLPSSSKRLGVTESESVSLGIGSRSGTTDRSADRSKLRLVIRDQQEWEEEQRTEIRQVLATVEDEVNTQMLFLESEVDEAIKRHLITPGESPFIAPLSPHTEAAMTLARIGDEIKDFYGDRLTMAVAGLCTEEQSVVSYENFRCVACSVIDQEVPGWRQVALLLVYGQSVAWRVAEFGYTEFGHLVSNTVRLISELYSEFITSQGGWGAVMQYESSLSSSLSPHHSSSENTSPREETGHKTEDFNLVIFGKDKAYVNHVNLVQDKSSGDHMTFVPPPDESACDQIINENHHSHDEHKTISLADILMTFSTSDGIENNQITESSDKSADCHEVFEPSIDECAQFRITDDTDNNNSFKHLLEDNHTISSPDENQGNKSDSNINQSTRLRPKTHQFNSQRNGSCSSIDPPSASNHNDASNICISDNDSPVHDASEREDSDSTVSFVQRNSSSNNNTSHQETVESNTQHGDIPPEQMVEYDETSDISLNGDHHTPYNYESQTSNESSDLFTRFFSVRTLATLGVCAIGIIVTIATSRR
ncbi:uncharacterized protein LOC127725476 [Mytilus californianus]|uniref:uncharacterized protein LOC127725476 n=1 Tax=Mytilus californianus TaxID=6549 RepID=UPI0022457ABA|nr:uncharacterized protein LOC127725476 [Mytilus californianus]XP_052088439.1 uncharacterized protein LOC127725476 [Mytilus californianus]